MSDLEQMKSLESICEYRDEQQRNYQIAMALKELVENEIYDISREILELQCQVKNLEVKKIDLRKALNKHKFECSRLAIEADRAKQKYFNTKI
jgi:hypothetical protein